MSKTKLSSKLPSAGFTLYEVLVVTLIIGVLSAIAIPSWIAFMERQKVNMARVQVVQVIREAQTKAKQTREAYGVLFEPTAIQPQVALAKYDVTTKPPTLISHEPWQILGNGQIKPGMLQMQRVPNNDNEPLVFNHKGWLAWPENNINNDFFFLSVISLVDKPGTRQCVLVNSLLGGIQETNDEDNRCVI